MNRATYPRHADILTDEQAIDYLGLIDVADTPEAAKRILQRFAGQGQLHPIKWAKKFLWSRPNLDEFVGRELSKLRGTAANVAEGTADQTTKKTAKTPTKA